MEQKQWLVFLLMKSCFDYPLVEPSHTLNVCQVCHFQIDMKGVACPAEMQTACLPREAIECMGGYFVTQEVLFHQDV